MSLWQQLPPLHRPSWGFSPFDILLCLRRSAPGPWVSVWSTITCGRSQSAMTTSPSRHGSEGRSTSSTLEPRAWTSISNVCHCWALSGQAQGRPKCESRQDRSRVECWGRSTAQVGLGAGSPCGSKAACLAETWKEGAAEGGVRDTHPRRRGVLTIYLFSVTSITCLESSLWPETKNYGQQVTMRLGSARCSNPIQIPLLP